MSALPVFEELHDWKVVIDERLAALLPPVRHPGDVVCAAMREGLLGPGKRIRPLMTVGVSLGFGQDPMALIDVACALEMVHAASLFLDDLPCMDDALERRGRPALHVQFGEDTALLASVALLSQAFRVVASSSELPTVLRCELVTLIADTIGPSGLVKGQYDDLRAGQCAGTANAANAQRLAEVNDLKTGVLFRTAMVMPAMMAGADQRTLDDIAQCAGDIGHAFQLRDDLDDSEGLVELMGRAHVDRLLGTRLDAAKETIRRLFPGDRALGVLLQSLATDRAAFAAPVRPLPRDGGFVAGPVAVQA